MKQSNYTYLRYRRQFLVSRAIIPELNSWQYVQIQEGLHIYAHPDLELVTLKDRDRIIVLAGYLFDFENPGANFDLASKALKSSDSFSSFLVNLKRLCGRYVIIYSDEYTQTIVHDPLGLREVYFAESYNRVICGSQPNLLSDFSEPKLDMVQDKSVLSFYGYLKKKRRGIYWIGDRTMFNEIKHLMPNHYLDMVTRQSKRYWPTQRLDSLDFDEAVELACKFLSGVLTSASDRYSLMMAVTSGYDSRTLLAASRDLTDNIYYFVNQEAQAIEQDPDIYIPRQIFDAINIPFHVHKPSHDIDDSFRDVFLDNVFLSTERILPTIYNVYYKYHQDKLNICGVGEIGRSRLGTPTRNLDGFFLASKVGHGESIYAISKCDDWLNENLAIAREYGLNPMDLFYWEQHLGNWGAVGNSESDIAIEEFNPYNSHYLFEIFLSIDAEKRQYYHNRLFINMINQLWPELLEYPINPPSNSRDNLRKRLKKLKVYNKLWFVRYYWQRVLFLFKTKIYSNISRNN